MSHRYVGGTCTCVLTPGDSKTDNGLVDCFHIEDGSMQELGLFVYEQSMKTWYLEIEPGVLMSKEFIQKAWRSLRGHVVGHLRDTRDNLDGVPSSYLAFD